MLQNQRNAPLSHLRGVGGVGVVCDEHAVELLVNWNQDLVLSACILGLTAVLMDGAAALVMMAKLMMLLLPRRRRFKS